MEKAVLNPSGFHTRLPLLPHQLLSRRTSTEDVIVLCHMGVPILDREMWSVKICGMVEKEQTLRFADLKKYPEKKLTAVHQCAGSPLKPTEPKRRVNNVEWTGVRLADVLADCGVSNDADYIWSYGADHGSFAGIEVSEYGKDLPLSRLQDDVLLAYGLNGAPLPQEHGFPVRLVVPGFYGTNSVKWLNQIVVEKGRLDNPFTTRWYNDPVIEGDTSLPSGPVWAIAPEAVVVSHGPKDCVAVEQQHNIWGWCWADLGVAQMAISFDQQSSWQSCDLEAAEGRAWQRFSFSWTPKERGTFTVSVRATDINGSIQPTAGARNAIQEIIIEVV